VTKTTFSSALSETFKYDPSGRRIYKSSSAGTSVYAFDEQNLIEETNSSGAVVARYAQGQSIDEPLAMLRSGATSFYNADGLGSITSLSNATGSLGQTYTFDSFGNQTASAGSLTNPFRYTAREFDLETGAYHYRARYYDSTVGRFASQDPLGFQAGFNFYTYGSNSPANFTDPLGLSPNDVLRLIIAARNATNDMTLNGDRTDPGAVNNVVSTLQRLNPFRKNKILKGCGEQTGTLINDLLPIIAHADANWSVDEKYEFLSWDHILPHQWAEYTSSDPNDPRLVFDPWNNRYQIVPPGGKQDNGGWHPLVPGVH
jgi:RHS repeat-associated protein